MQSNATPDWLNELPRELLIEIITNLHTEDAVRLFAVSTAMLQLADNYYWYNRLRLDFPSEFERLDLGAVGNIEWKKAYIKADKQYLDKIAPEDRALVSIVKNGDIIEFKNKKYTLDDLFQYKGKKTSLDVPVILANINGNKKFLRGVSSSVISDNLRKNYQLTNLHLALLLYPPYDKKEFISRSQDLYKAYRNLNELSDEDISKLNSPLKLYLPYLLNKSSELRLTEITTMQLAAMLGNRAAIDFLREYNVPLDEQTIILAAYYGHENLAIDLLKLSPQLNHDDKKLLKIAIKQGLANLLHHLFMKHDATFYNDVNPVMLAAESGHVNIMQALANTGMALDQPDNSGMTPLYSAASLGNLRIVKYLHDNNEANLNPEVILSNILFQSAPNQSALETAAANNHEIVVDWLLDNKVNMDFSKERFERLMFQAIRFGMLRLFEQLLEMTKQNINDISIYITPNTWEEIKSGERTYPLLAIAAFNKQLPILEFLLSKSANIHVRFDVDNTKGRTLLHSAVFRPNQIKYFVEKGLDPNVTDADNETPLFLATFHKRSEAVKALIELGASPNARSKQGETCLFKIKFVTYVNAKEDEVKTNLEVTEILSCLFEAKADPNIKNNKGETALHKAVAMKDHRYVKILLDNGADPEGALESKVMKKYLSSNKKDVWADKSEAKIANLLTRAMLDKIVAGLLKDDKSSHQIMDNVVFGFNFGTSCSPSETLAAAIALKLVLVGKRPVDSLQSHKKALEHRVLKDLYVPIKGNLDLIVEFGKEKTKQKEPASSTTASSTTPSSSTSSSSTPSSTAPTPKR